MKYIKKWEAIQLKTAPISSEDMKLKFYLIMRVIYRRIVYRVNKKIAERRYDKKKKNNNKIKFKCDI